MTQEQYKKGLEIQKELCRLEYSVKYLEEGYSLAIKISFGHDYDYREIPYAREISDRAIDFLSLKIKELKEEFEKL